MRSAFARLVCAVLVLLRIVVGVKATTSGVRTSLPTYSLCFSLWTKYAFQRESNDTVPNAEEIRLILFLLPLYNGLRFIAPCCVCNILCVLDGKRSNGNANWTKLFNLPRISPSSKVRRDSKTSTRCTVASFPSFFQQSREGRGVIFPGSSRCRPGPLLVAE